MTLTPSRRIIPPYLKLNLLQIRMANSSSMSGSDCDIHYRACIGIFRRRTGIVESPTDINSSFVISAIKRRYVLCRIPYICCVLFLVPGGTYFHLEPLHAVHTRLRKD